MTQYSSYVTILDLRTHLQDLIISDYTKCMWFKHYFELNIGAESTTPYRKQMRDYSHVTYRLSAYADLYNFITHSDFDWVQSVRDGVQPFTNTLF